MNWEDVTVYTVGRPHTPQTWKLRLPNATVLVTRWVGGASEEWYLLSYDLGVRSHRLLPTTDSEEAKIAAIATVLPLLRQLIENLQAAEKVLVELST